MVVESLLPTAQSHFIYRFYFAFDHNDTFYANASWRSVIDGHVAGRVKMENARRAVEDAQAGHMGKYSASPILVSVHWVRCPHTGKPSWAHSDAATAAVHEGADYVFR